MQANQVFDWQCKFRPLQRRIYEVCIEIQPLHQIGRIIEDDPLILLHRAKVEEESDLIDHLRDHPDADP